MIDCIRTKLILPDSKIPSEILNGVLQPFDWEGLTFFPKEDHSYHAVKDSMTKIGMGNMYMVFRNGIAGTLHLSNSLHKVAHNGANHTDFKYSELVETIGRISDTFGIDFPNADLVGKFEFAVNLKMPNANEFYQAARFLGSIKARPMLGKTKQYGTEFSRNSYRIKMYSPLQKETQSGNKNAMIQSDILRYEYVTTVPYLRQKKIELRKVKDLLNIENLRNLGHELTQSAKQILFSTMLPTGMDFSNCMIFHFFNNPDEALIQHCIANDKKSFDYYKRRFKKLQKHDDHESPDLRALVNEKWTELLAN